ncbi:MAG TPA: CBS domain-containing protein [Actinomycetes bacterium]|nr:CBS domain-containing protein [Actinomycetes bacterium]
MQVREAMTGNVVTVGPGHSLRQASQVMADRNIGSVVIVDPEANGPGILTERDIVRAVAAGVDLDVLTSTDYLTADVTYAAPEWTLDEASEAMRRGGFRHLVVVQGGEVLGMISMRDIVRAWAPQHSPS